MTTCGNPSTGNARAMTEDGVSPVMGAILLIAITIILSVTIGMVLQGVGSTLHKPDLMVVSVLPDRTISLRYITAPDEFFLDSLLITAPNGTLWYTSDPGGGLTIITASSPKPAKPAKGATINLAPAPDWPEDKKHIIAIATYGGMESRITQTLLDTYV